MVLLGLLLAAVAAASEPPSYVNELFPLEKVVRESTVIAEAVVEKVDGKRRLVYLKVGKVWKGTCRYDVIRVNVGVGDSWHPAALMRHLVVGAPAVVFYNKLLAAEVYFNRFFFQLQGDPRIPAANLWWNFTHVEVKMNRTYCGTVAGMRKAIRGAMEEGAPVPKPRASLPPITAADLKALPPPGKSGELPASFGGGS